MYDKSPAQPDRLSLYDTALRSTYIQRVGCHDNRGRGGGLSGTRNTLLRGGAILACFFFSSAGEFSTRGHGRQTNM